MPPLPSDPTDAAVSTAETSPETNGPDDSPQLLAWLAPGAMPTPREAMQRIQWLCETQPTLFDAMWLVCATHATVPREVLAAAVRQFRPDAAIYSTEDLTGMLVALRNGALQAFDAVLRSRKTGERKVSGGLGWLKTDD